MHAFKIQLKLLFIILINGADFDKCGSDIDGGDCAVGRYDLHSTTVNVVNIKSL
jgi:hypothetical protein